MESRLVLNTRQLTPICPRVARAGVARADAANRNRMYYSFYVSLLKKNLQNCLKIAKQKNKTNTSTLFLLMPRPGRLLEHHTGFIISPPWPPTRPTGYPPGLPPGPTAPLMCMLCHWMSIAKNFFKRRPCLLEYGCVILVLYCILSSH